jgi:hypothetical protein
MVEYTGESVFDMGDCEFKLSLNLHFFNNAGKSLVYIFDVNSASFY